ncbi:MAG: SpoIVB peptidase S55 domain-containing protein [Aeromicrobium sp.]
MSASIANRVGRLALIGAVALTSMALPVTVSAAPGECPQIMPLSNIHAGQVGTGWTVAQGSEPEQFNVEVLGVLDNGIAPGRDMVVIEVSDAPGSTFIEDAGGIWSGMSGSPVYINGKLAGAVAYGFSSVTSPVGGMTPASHMDDILNYSSATAAEQSAARVSIPQAMRSDLADRAGISQAQASSLSRLPVPFAVSGVPARGLERLEQSLERQGLDVILTTGGRARAAGVATARPMPGGNFAAVLSYGDITAGGIGTTTYVCGDQALAFGHPMQFRGRAAYGANDANAITIFADAVFGSFKLANITDLFGTVDQDRLMGIRAALGDGPSLILVKARVSSSDTGNDRIGRSRATMDEFVPDVGFLELLSNIDLVVDHGAGAGSARVRWTVSGERQNGNPWSYTNENRLTSLDDISFETAATLANELFAIQTNPYENISFQSVEARIWVEDVVKRNTIEQVKISKNGGPFRERDFMTLAPGDELRLRVKLRQTPNNALVTQTLTLDVPEDAFGEASLVVQGGGDRAPDECAFFPGTGCEGGFLGQLEAIDSLPRADTLNARLELFDVESPEVLASVDGAVDRATYGSFGIGVSIEP